MDLLPSFSVFGVFLGIAAIGFLFLIITLISGGIVDFFEFDHDFEVGGPGLFSSRIIAVFVTAFGGTGAIATHYGVPTPIASAIGVGSGFFFGGLIFLFARFLYAQQASSDVRPADLIGQSARVVIAIPAGGLGQVRCRIGEELVDKIARARDGSALPENTPVVIDEFLGDTVIVKKA